MKLKFIKSTWGMTEDKVYKKLERIKSSGYDGVESHVPDNVEEKENLRNALQEFDLIFIAQQWTTGKNLREHKISFETQFLKNIELEPVFVNSHTGKDFYDTDENLELIDFAEDLASKHSIKLLHETHRGRFSYSAKRTSDYLKLRPKLRLVADFSHWCCVSESLLEDQTHFVDEAAAHSDHIHARIGFSQSPQVNEPRAPEWEELLKIYLKWWRKIIEHHSSIESEYLTITPEFGPVPYMPTEPYSQKPLADLWDINMFMKQIISEQFPDFV